MAGKKGAEKKGAVTVAENKAKALEMALQQIEKTYGKGCGQEGIFLSDGSVVFITTFLYSPPFSENYDGVGIQPDHQIYLEREWRSTNILLIPHEEDNQLGRALDVLHFNTKFAQ